MKGIAVVPHAHEQLALWRKGKLILDKEAGQGSACGLVDGVDAVRGRCRRGVVVVVGVAQGQSSQ